MASNVLHIKDAYYFEVPKALWPSNRQSIDEFPDFWVRLDPGFQHLQAEQLAEFVAENCDGAPTAATIVKQWSQWQHSDHANAGRPLDYYLELQHDAIVADFAAWKGRDKEGRAGKEFVDYLNEFDPQFEWFAVPYHTSKQFRDLQWNRVKREVGGPEAVAKYQQEHSWDPQTIAGYNRALSGKVLIPQPFGTLRNLYQQDSGFCISKFMVIEVVLALILVAMFSWLGRRMQGSDRPKGKIWNLLEAFLLFIRDQIARPAIHHGADRFVPLLWTMFMFVLGCNLFGMLPWAGAPTGSFAVTSALALVTLGTVCLAGMKKFGPLGFVLNQIPSMDLPAPMAVLIKPMLLAIELLGLAIKHGVLAVRLLANMVAGHLVLLGVMGLAFGAHAAHQFQGDAAGWWLPTAIIAVLGSTLFSLLELFVAFLQAYIFTFLSALFIGAAVDSH